jgi:3-phosphoshikimate 1-carboxyvinyltransferase
MSAITIRADAGKVTGTVGLPLSKSISNRALIISALSRESVHPGELSSAEDTVMLKDILPRCATTDTCELDAGNAGTVFRFLTAYLAATPGEYLLEGHTRMHERPIAPLVDALHQLGAEIEYTGKRGFPPLRIRGKKLKGGKVSISPGLSSQFVSALMMIGPAMPGGLAITIESTPGSLPYIEMTAQMMLRAGAEINSGPHAIHISGSGYGNARLPSEADWSAAAFWYQLLALSCGESLLLEGLIQDSIQGDKRSVEYFRPLGIETSFTGEGALITKSADRVKYIHLNLKDCPDLAPPLILTAAASGIRGEFHGLEALRAKESDRLKALAAELEKAGVKCDVTSGSITFQPQKMTIPKAFDTYGDHRLAMAFAPLAILGSPVTIKDASAVNKSYPGYWKELKKITAAKA